jgi:hypothetical protein
MTGPDFLAEVRAAADALARAEARRLAACRAAFAADSLRIPDAYTWTRNLTPRQVERRRSLPVTGL